MKTKITEFVELTDNRHPDWSELRQVRLVKRLPHRYWIAEGTLGGWVVSEDNLEGRAWIDDEVLILSEDARVKDDALVSGKVKLWGHAKVLNTAYVYGGGGTYSSLKGSTTVRNEAEVTGFFFTHGSVVIGDRAYISGRGIGGLYVAGLGIEILGLTSIRGTGSIGDGCKISGGEYKGDLHLYKANLTEAQHLLTVGPLGSEDQMATLYRSGTGENGEHTLMVGCWSGTVDQLSDEVEERSKNWRADLETKNLWMRKYVLLEKLCEMTIEGWGK